MSVRAEQNAISDFSASIDLLQRRGVPCALKREQKTETWSRHIAIFLY